MPQFRRSIVILAAGILAHWVAQASAETVTLEAVQDVYIRSSSSWRDVNLNVDQTGLGTHSVIVGGGYWGLFQWDLSSITSEITGAHIEFYVVDDPDGDNANQPANFQAWLMTPPEGVGGTGLDETTTTYNIYAADVNDHQTLLESLGSLMQDPLGSAGLNQYYQTQPASAADLALLNERRTRPSGEQYAFIELTRVNSSGGWRWFSGHEDGNAARLVLTTGSPTVPGDFNNDGNVDGEDFVVWQMHFPTQSGANVLQGDADGDGDVDGADFVVWQTNFPFNPGAGASPVPEPTAWILALVAAAGFCLIGLRRRKAISHNAC